MDKAVKACVVEIVALGEDGVSLSICVVVANSHKSTVHKDEHEAVCSHMDGCPVVESVGMPKGGKVKARSVLLSSVLKGFDGKFKKTVPGGRTSDSVPLTTVKTKGSCGMVSDTPGKIEECCTECGSTVLHEIGSDCSVVGPKVESSLSVAKTVEAL